MVEVGYAQSMSMSAEAVLYEVGDGVARITLNRPEKRNALNAVVVRGVREGLARSAGDEGVRVVVIAGAGKDFCSGADLAALEKIRDGGVLENLADAGELAELFLAMRRHPRPVVAAVQGRALAGGCGLATACDIVLASESARFGYPEVNIGFIPAIVMAILRRAVPEKTAFELIVGGEVLGAPRMAELGIVQRVFADEAFDGEVAGYVGLLSGKPAAAVMLAKRLLYGMDGMSLESAVEAGVQANAIARMTEECRRGVEGFLLKRGDRSQEPGDSR